MKAYLVFSRLIQLSLPTLSLHAHQIEAVLQSRQNSESCRLEGDRLAFKIHHIFTIDLFCDSVFLSVSVSHFLEVI